MNLHRDPNADAKADPAVIGNPESADNHLGHIYHYSDSR